MKPTLLSRLVLVFVILTLGVAVPSVHARIGDTELKVLMDNLGTRVDRDSIDEKASVIVFTTDKGQHAYAILNGRVEGEIFTLAGDAKFSEDFVLSEVRSYREVWFPVSCEDDCVAVMSPDGKLFAKLGASKALSKRNVFFIFSNLWQEFSQSKTKKIRI